MNTLFCFSPSSRLNVHVKNAFRRFISTNKRTYYEILGLKTDVNQAVIKSTFYQLSLIYHPDKNSDAESMAKFQQVSEAYEVLGNYKKRKLYDRGLLNQETYRNDSEPSHDFEEPKNIRFYQRRNKPRVVHTGRTPIYNFDEFYRVHYGSHMEELKMRTKKQTAIDEQNFLDDSNIVLYMISGIFLIAFVSVFASAYLEDLVWPESWNEIGPETSKTNTSE